MIQSFGSVLARIIHEICRPRKDMAFSLILGLRPPRNLPSLPGDTHCMSVGQVKPLKHHVLSPRREVYE